MHAKQISCNNSPTCIGQAVRKAAREAVKATSTPNNTFLCEIRRLGYAIVGIVAEA